MAYIGQSIDTNGVEYNSGSRDPLPAGVYSAVVVRTQQKDTKKRDGLYLEVEFDITGPQYAGRKFWDNFNLMNPNPDAVRIGLEQLGKLGKAAGLPVLEDDQQLLNAEVQIELYIGKDKDGTPRNRVGGYYPAGVDVKAFKEQLRGQPGGGQKAQPQPAQAAAPARPAAAPQGGVPSWRKPVA